PLGLDGGHCRGSCGARSCSKACLKQRQLKKAPAPLAPFFGAPGRAHPLGGESPLLARQGEQLAERQGCPSRGGIRRKPQAKRRPDEQKLHEAAMRDERAKKLKVQYLYGTHGSRCSGHKREGGCALPGEVCLSAR